MMNRFQLAVLFICLGILFTACSKQDQAMPITKKNLNKYFKAADESVQNFMAEEKANETVKMNDAQKAEFLTKILVKPIEEMGYSYDKTIAAAAQMIISKDYPSDDLEFQLALSKLLEVPGQRKLFFYEHKLISEETRNLLILAQF